MKFIEFSINSESFVVPVDISIIESCKFTGIQIPRFCYHELLSVSGNCRMCLVEIESTDKLVLACLTNIESGFEILTNSLFVKKARESVLEALLLNHPLDCPICDQGGECDLQDQTKNYGNFFNKIFSNRRGVEDKNFGSIVKTIMTRCIHCTRCVRYSTEILGLESLGTLNRGTLTEIGTYSSNFNESNITGNIIDLCPVGALTSKNHSFQTRPWELRSLETVDLTDSIGANIFVNHKETEIIRILPKPNTVNGTIISDKTRFSFDGLLNNRIYDNNKYLDSKWNELLSKYINSESFKEKLLIVINEQIDLKIINRLKFLTFININIKLRSFTRYNEFENSYVFSNNLFDFEKDNFFSCFILLSSNIEIENEIINSKIRIQTLNENYFLYNTNRKYKSKIINNYINLNVLDIISFIEGKFLLLSKYITQMRPHFIISENLKKRFWNIKYFLSYLKNTNHILSVNIINMSCNSEGHLFLGIKSLNLKDILLSNNFIFINLNENLFLKRLTIPSIKSIFHFNSFSINSIKKNNYTLPFNLINFESTGFFINLEQKFQKTQKIITFIDNSSYFDKIFDLFYKKKYTFKYLDFIKENFTYISDNTLLNIYSKSIIKNEFKDKLQSFISLHPIKMFYQDNTKLNNLSFNSYNISISILKQRYNSL